MGLRIKVAVATVLVVLATALPAHANVGTYCGGWETGDVAGVSVNACYERTFTWQIRGRAKAFYDGSRTVVYLAISVQLQRSPDGYAWTNVRSNVCGWSGGDVASSAPGNICNTNAIAVDAGYLYRSRAQVTVYYANGATATTGFVYSGLTT
jgi:hypothetical protein